MHKHRRLPKKGKENASFTEERRRQTRQERVKTAQSNMNSEKNATESWEPRREPGPDCETIGTDQRK